MDRLLRRFAWWRRLRGYPEPMAPAMVAIAREVLTLVADQMERHDLQRRQNARIRVRMPAQYVRRVEDVSNG